MADMATCACGWTVISPLGQADAIKYVRIHLKDSHPGTTITDDEIRKLVKKV